MKLYDVKYGSRIRVKEDPTIPPAAPEIKSGQELKFCGVDGMYSKCYTNDNELVHIAAWTEVEVL